MFKSKLVAAIFFLFAVIATESKDPKTFLVRYPAEYDGCGAITPARYYRMYIGDIFEIDYLCGDSSDPCTFQMAISKPKLIHEMNISPMGIDCEWMGGGWTAVLLKATKAGTVTIDVTYHECHYVYEIEIRRRSK